ncbi:GPR54-like protein, partial [Mya arenaria]
MFGNISLGKLIPLLENGVVHVSILTMMAVTLERFNALCEPLRRRMPYNVAMTVKTLLVIWIMGIAFAIPFFLITVLEDARFYDGSEIMVCRTKMNTSLKRAYTLFIVCAFFVVPFFIVVYIYTNIIRKLMSETIKPQTQNDRMSFNVVKARKQVVYMLIFIIVLFFVTLSPIRIVSLWLIFAPRESVERIGLEGFLNIISWARVLMYLNSAGNPIIYGMTSTKFRHNIKRLLRRYGGSLFVSNNTTPPETRQPKTVKKSYKCLHIFVHHKEDNERKVNTDNKNTIRETQKDEIANKRSKPV